jgi:diguanylate cyclase (GGDEF)-like protein
VPAIQPGARTDGPEHATTRLAHVKQLVSGRNAAWAAVAGLCVALGAFASVLGARDVARNDSAAARQAFPRTSTAIASTVKLAVAHEEDLLVGASTFFAGNPKASAAEFDTWVKWAQALRRYPELQSLGLVALVRAPELAAFRARLSGHPLAPSGSLARLSASAGAVAAGAGTGPYHCLTAVELTRPAVSHPRAGLDYCTRMPALASARDSAVSVYTQTSVANGQTLVVHAPVYKGNLPPSPLKSRRAAFVGWLREVLTPGVVLEGALSGHPGYAVRVRYKNPASNVAFTSGSTQPGEQSTTINLHGGWSVRTYAPRAVALSAFSDGTALPLLIVGVVLSLLLGALVFVLGGGRPRPLPRPVRALPHPDLYDPLTGLPNRALMLDRAERMLARASRQPGLLTGALFIDIDWFSDVNDKLGEPAGDQLLTIVAERLEGVVRTHDTVGRLGGDEFVVLVESAARGVRLDSLARRVVEAMHKPVELEGFRLSFSLTASIGVAFGRYEAPDDLLRDARLALTAAQAAGRDRYTLFNANMRSVIEGRGVLEMELNTALQENQFFLLYQPVFDLNIRKVVGLEALIRWQHPTQGVLSPDDFIPLSEDTGLIVPIGRWALEEACRRAAGWNVTGHRLGVSVKVAASQLNRDGFVTDVRRALQQSGLAPSLLTLEVGETTVMLDIADVARRLQEIKELGVSIAIGEFGSGYAQHADLQRMPLDYLKVDRSALAASDDEDYRNWLLRTLLIVGHDLSVPVIATGIESYEQMAAVQEMGYPMAQGFFLGGPAAADSVDGLFTAELPSAPADAAAAPANVSD